MLTGPLNAFPWALNGLVESFVSIKRIGQLLALSKIDPEKYFSPITDVVDEVLCLTLIKVCPTLSYARTSEYMDRTLKLPNT